MNVRGKLPVPMNFQITEASDGYHASWAYFADLSQVSAFNMYREETFANGSRLGAESRVFQLTWHTCGNGLCLNVYDGIIPEGEEVGSRVGSGTLECNATGCYFGYTDTEGLNPTSTYRYFLRMVNAEGIEDNQIIITDEERRQQEAASEVASGPSEEVPLTPEQECTADGGIWDEHDGCIEEENESDGDSGGSTDYCDEATIGALALAPGYYDDPCGSGTLLYSPDLEQCMHEGGYGVWNEERWDWDCSMEWPNP